MHMGWHKKVNGKMVSFKGSDFRVPLETAKLKQFRSTIFAKTGANDVNVEKQKDLSRDSSEILILLSLWCFFFKFGVVRFNQLSAPKRYPFKVP